MRFAIHFHPHVVDEKRQRRPNMRLRPRQADGKLNNKAATNVDVDGTLRDEDQREAQRPNPVVLPLSVGRGRDQQLLLPSSDEDT